MVEKIGAPTPSVVHLVTLFRQISNGEIKIPAFQRDYVWTEKQIISLLDSVYESFPIGSLLFWRVEQKALEIAPRKLTAFPESDEVFPMNYVLDGMQRLTTLYGVFHYENKVTNPNLNIGFELRQKRFKSLSQSAKSNEIIVPLSTLFSPKKLLEFQGVLAEKDDSDELLDTVLKLQAAFQDYMIPTVTIQSSDVERVVGIFERVNSTGTRLNSVDFMRAITWTSSFDLTQKINNVSAEISNFGWELRHDTIIKCVAIVLGMDVSSESLLDLRNVDEQRLHDAFSEIPNLIFQTSELLEASFEISSPNIVSYEGQLLVAFTLCYLGTANEVKNDFIRWFWACGLNEQLRGKPDDYVVNLLSDWASAHNSGVYSTSIQPSFTSRDFQTRRLLARSAFTNTYKMLFAKSGAIDLENRETIMPWEYMSSSSTEQFLPILNKNQLECTNGLVGDRIASAKIFCNTILLRQGANIEQSKIIEHLLMLLNQDEIYILESQFITRQAAEYLRDGELAKFLVSRAERISEFSQSLIK